MADAVAAKLAAVLPRKCRRLIARFIANPPVRFPPVIPLLASFGDGTIHLDIAAIVAGGEDGEGNRTLTDNDA